MDNDYYKNFEKQDIKKRFKPAPIVPPKSERDQILESFAKAQKEYHDIIMGEIEKMTLAIQELNSRVSELERGF